MRVVIVGNGVTGITAALRIREHEPTWQISVVSGESQFHFSRPALMYIFMGHMGFRETKPFPDHYWADQKIDLVRAWATAIDTEQRMLRLHEADDLPYDILILATGSQPNKFGWPGQDLDGVQGLWGLHDLKALYDTVPRTKHAVIVGGGLIGIELAEMVHSRGIGVSFLVREKSYWNSVLPAQESSIINELIRESGMNLLLETELQEIIDDGNGRCCGVMTSHGDRIDCQLVGLTAGVRPNLDLVQESAIESGRGILVDSRFRTNVEGVYAAGDCAEIVRPGEERNLVQQVWYTGKMQAEVVADEICGKGRDYDSGTWFNSAKFLDLEYQTYGRVNMKVPGEKNIYWEHPDRRHAVRIVYGEDGNVIGFNLMGIRWRHVVCERWLEEQRSVRYVLDRLGEAHFDPEFYRRHESQIVSALKGQLQ